MGLSLNELDRHKEALEFYNQSLGVDPTDITALMNKAISLSHLGDYKDAIDYYDKAQVIDPTQKEIPSAKSQLFLKLGLEDDAFLAAQGVLNKEIVQIKLNAEKNKCTVFHQFCEEEFERYDSK